MASKEHPLIDPSLGTGTFGLLALVSQAVITAAFYNAELDLSQSFQTDSSSIYNFHVGVALMMFVGFGYLMTFLKAYGLGAVGFTMYITCIGAEFAIIMESYMGKGNLLIDFQSLLKGNFAVAAVLISFGGLIGKISPSQITILTFMELTFYCANKVYVLGQYSERPLVADCGGTIIIHVFGAYFGLCVCSVLGPAYRGASLNASTYNSDIFSLIGTTFLWLFWPSFVAGTLPAGPAQTKALINTVLALMGSTVTTFALTPLMSSGKLNTAAIQNATLAGGVAVGSTADFLGPFGAIVVGGLAGLLSTWGFITTPFFQSVDTCGISNLHGMPGIFGGLVSIAVPFLYPNANIVALHQLAGLSGTLLVACASGIFTGYVLKAMGTLQESFHDQTFWACAVDVVPFLDDV